ncbi:MAG: hypothetical protein ACJ762_11500 [Solirubrobacteraceae bacterium]
MSRRLTMERRSLRARLEKGDPTWPPQLAVAAAIALHVGLSEQVSIGSRWTMPAVEAALLLALVVVAPARADSHSRGRRTFSLAVVGVVTAANVVSLGLLIHRLVAGTALPGNALIGSGVLLWATTVLLFAVWLWEMDRGGPVVRHLDPTAQPDLLFPQMENPSLAPPGWRPGFGDYLYTSLTNATAFSPTDVMPLTHSAKLVMALESVTALATLGLVVARAVNVLG